MFGSVSNWWSKGGDPAQSEGDPIENNETGIKLEAAERTQAEVLVQVPNDADENEDNNIVSGQKSPTEELEDASLKALNTAKDWGSYIFTFGKKATEVAVATAVQLKDTVEEKTIIGNFKKEQEKFVTENMTRKKMEEAAVAPWVGYNEETDIKNKILALSSDKRNFMRNPPAGVQFSFEFVTASPIAMVMLQEDPNLKAMRFDLVPKQIAEEAFWRNYFYRVSLIKQSAQLKSLAQQTGSDSLSSRSSRTSSSESLHRDKASSPVKNPDKAEGAELEEPLVGSPPIHEFASDAFQDSQFNEEEMKKEMRLLGMQDGELPEEGTTSDDDIPEWERELQAELQEYEVVDDGTTIGDNDLEQEILQQIEAEAKQQNS